MLTDVSMRSLFWLFSWTWDWFLVTRLTKHMFGGERHWDAFFKSSLGKWMSVSFLRWKTEQEERKTTRAWNNYSGFLLFPLFTEHRRSRHVLRTEPALQAEINSFFPPLQNQPTGNIQYFFPLPSCACFSPILSFNSKHLVLYSGLDRGSRLKLFPFWTV